jgi:hypothetical protein
MLAALGFFSFGGEKLFQNQKVSARPCHEVEHFYYDEPTQGNQVGYKWLTCYTTYSWGIETQYELVVDGDDCGWC